MDARKRRFARLLTPFNADVSAQNMKMWRQLGSKKLVQDRWLSLRADSCELPNGHIVDPYYVIEDAEWVHVFAQDCEDRVLIVRQYRYAANAECAELPGGVVEPDETSLTAARRELQEETGFIADEWIKVGKVFANPARQTNAIHIYLASGLSAQNDQQLDESEAITFEFASVNDIKTMIEKGEFSQSLHIASFYMSLEAMSRAAR